MRKALALFLSTSLLSLCVAAQTVAPPQQQQQGEEEVVRITSELVQTDVVVTDKDDRVINDLKLGDFEVYENGKKQDLKFIEYVGVDEGRRIEGARPDAPPESARIERELSARDVRRVVAFVVDDLTIPFADMATVRQVLLDFVDNKMQQGDLVAIVRTVGGKGLLQQFTSDKQLLRRAISQLNYTSNYYSRFDNPDPPGLTEVDLTPPGGGAASVSSNTAAANDALAKDVTDETTNTMRGLIGLSTANSVIDSLRQIPGRKSLVLFSAGVPFLQTNSTGGLYATVSQVLDRLKDNALRSGVVVNTMDPRGLNATPGVGRVDDPRLNSQSALMGGNAGFGRGQSDLEKANLGEPLAGAGDHLSLRTLSNATGGVAVVNTNDFKAGLDKVLARSRGYYVLAYTPSEKFDNKFRKLDVKVRRDGTHIYKQAGYIAREESRAAPRTKQEEVMDAARSPLAKRDLDVSSNLSLKMTPPKGADLGINLLVDPKTLNFTQSDDKYHTTFDVVGFILDGVGKTRGGFSETINANLTPAEYQEAMRTGLTYSADTQLPPGYYQLRAVVREEGTGNLGTVSRYIEVPDLTKGRLAMSSVFLYTVDLAGPSTPVPMTAVRRLSRKQDLRYSAVIYNAKLEGGKPQLRSQTIISRGDKVVYRGAEQAVVPLGSDPTQVFTVDQVGLSKAAPGRYVLTLTITDTLADKKTQTITRSIDFDIVE
jgi:VWFA-related protein